MPITGRGGAETPSPRPRLRETRGIPPFLGVCPIGHGAQTGGFPRVCGHLVHRLVHRQAIASRYMPIASRVLKGASHRARGLIADRLTHIATIADSETGGPFNFPGVQLTVDTIASGR